MTELTLSTNIKEEDYEPLFIINWHCFHDSPSIAAFFPGGLDPAYRSANIESMKLGVFSGPNREYAKISTLSPTTGKSKIIAFIALQIHPGSHGILSSPTPSHQITLPQITDPKDREFYEWFWNSMATRFREVKEFQVPHVGIHTIGTDPEWRRGGAGRIMMEWYLGVARREGIGRCVLSAGPFAAEIGFYEGFGFRRGETIVVVDEDRFAGRVVSPGVVMFRDV